MLSKTLSLHQLKMMSVGKYSKLLTVQHMYLVHLFPLPLTTHPAIFDMIDQYNFIGDSVTYLGLVGIISTAIIMSTAFRRHARSPLNK